MYRIYLILTLTISTINWTRRFNARRSEFLKISIRKTSIRGWMDGIIYTHCIQFPTWFVHEIMNARVSLSVGGTERERGRDREGKKKTGLDVAPIRKYSYYAQLHGLLVRQYLFYRPDAVPLSLLLTCIHERRSKITLKFARACVILFHDVAIIRV